jgi:hypothetical protein
MNDNSIRRALSAELQIEAPEPLQEFRREFITPPPDGSTQAGSLPFLVPMVYPFESQGDVEQLEDHIIESLSRVKKFKVFLRGITGYPGGFVLLNVKSGNDRLILMHDLLHQGALKGLDNPLYSYFPHVLLFRCPTAEATRDAIMRGQRLQQGFEATVEAVRIESISAQGEMALLSAIELES